MAMQSKGSVLAAIETILGNLTFPDGVTDEQVFNFEISDYMVTTATAFAGDNLFQEVEKFDVLDIERALGKLLQFNDRLALVVPMPVYWSEPKLDGGTLVSTRTLPVSVIISDRNYSGLGKAAFFGDATEYPGVFDLMADLIIDALSGSFMAENSAVRAVPTGEQSIYVATDEKNLKNGREGYRIFFDISCGQIRKPLQRGQTART